MPWKSRAVSESMVTTRGCAGANTANGSGSMARAIGADMLLLVGKAGSGSDPVATLRGVTRSSSSVLRCSVCSADQSDTGDSSDACSILIVANFDDVLPAVMRPPAIAGSPICFRSGCAGHGGHRTSQRVWLGACILPKPSEQAIYYVRRRPSTIFMTSREEVDTVPYCTHLHPNRIR